jgi:hypothetical protein
MPKDPHDGRVLIDVVGDRMGIYGDPEPLAAEYAAAVHREIAAHAEEIRHYNGFTTAEDVADWLLARADLIEGTSR